MLKLQKHDIKVNESNKLGWCSFTGQVARH